MFIRQRRPPGFLTACSVAMSIGLVAPAVAEPNNAVVTALSRGSEAENAALNLQAMQNSADTGRYRVDFGATSTPTTATGWNNISDAEAKDTLSSVPLKDSAGVTSTARLHFTDAFNCRPSGPASNVDGATTSTLYPATATDDSIFLGLADGGVCTRDDLSASFDISGLVSGAPYEVHFYASRMGAGSNRTTNYTIGMQTVQLNATDNVNNFATIASSTATDGVLRITISKAAVSQTYGYLGVVDIARRTTATTPCPAKRFAVIGSSTAYGVGALPISNSWANRYTAYLKSFNANNSLVNLAQKGYTTYQALPSGSAPPAGRPPPDTSRNISAAIAQKPQAIIVNLPTNDITVGYSQTEIRTNFRTIHSAAERAAIPLWITTAQPRNLSRADRDQLSTFTNWIRTTYGTRSIDFWTLVANSDGTIESIYANEDGVHLNNAGHDQLYQSVVRRNILASLCP